MALSSIIKHIHDKAAEEIAAIEARSKAELTALEETQSQELELQRQKLLEQVDRSAKAQYAHIVLSAKEKAKEVRLLAEQGVMDEVYSLVMEKLEHLSSSEYQSILASLLQPLKKQTGQFVTSKKLRDALVQATKKSGCEGMVSSETIETIGGFVFRATSIDQDLTFETLMSTVRQETITEVYQQLFGSHHESR